MQPQPPETLRQATHARVDCAATHNAARKQQLCLVSILVMFAASMTLLEIEQIKQGTSIIPASVSGSGPTQEGTLPQTPQATHSR